MLTPTHALSLFYTNLDPNRFFFQENADIRHLHSFPTRRSSDLVNGGRLTHYPGDYQYYLDKTAADSARTALRSEEHTSELQSRENLVCRLLLEKKKPQG